MKTILIGTSFFGNPISDYYKALFNSLIDIGKSRVIFVFDKNINELPVNTESEIYFTWPSKRPTKLKDFIFLHKIIKTYKPVLCLSNFGSTNVITIVSYLLGVKNRINYIHTTSKQIETDSQNKFLSKILKVRKKYILKLCTYYFTNSLGTKKDVIKNFKIDEEKIEIYPLLLKNTDVLYKDRSERDFCIIIVGRLHPSKGHKELLIQFSHCLLMFPKLKLKIIGSGLLKNSLLQLVSELEISANVDFLGNLTHKEVELHFSTALISVSSSIEEAYGLINIEALRSGTPLVCTRTAGAIDILNDNNNGKYYDSKIKESFCNSIHKIFESWETYSKSAKKSFEEKYSLEKNILVHAIRIDKTFLRNESDNL